MVLQVTRCVPRRHMPSPFQELTNAPPGLRIQNQDDGFDTRIWAVVGALTAALFAGGANAESTMARRSSECSP